MPCDCHSGSFAAHDTVWAVLESPLTAGHTVTFEPFDLDIPTSGAWEVTLQTCPQLRVLADYSTTMWSSGWVKMSMTWWGDYETWTFVGASQYGHRRAMGCQHPLAAGVR